MPLQRPTVRASLFLEGEGEDDGEGEEEVMGRHRVLGRMGPSLAFTQAMVGHKWIESHPSADSQTQAPAREPDTNKRARGVPLAELWLRKCNHLPHHKLDLSMHSQFHLLPYTCSANSRGPIILRTSCACRRGQDKAVGSREGTASGKQGRAMQNLHVNVQAQPVHIKQQQRAREG